MTDSELASLLRDCLTVWGLSGRVIAGPTELRIAAGSTSCTVARAPPERRPARWMLQSEERAVAGRPPQGANSITGLLGGLRSALGADAPGFGLDVAEPPWAEPP